MSTLIPSHLSDSELIVAIGRLVESERGVTTSLVAHLVEFDARDLYLREGFPSLLAYCCEVLHLSEHEAYNRIEAARASRRFPVALERLAEGSLNLTTVRLLAPRLTEQNHRELLAAAFISESAKSNNYSPNGSRCLSHPRPFASFRHGGRSRWSRHRH
jgi:hypothetical protein